MRRVMLLMLVAWSFTAASARAEGQTTPPAPVYDPGPDITDPTATVHPDPQYTMAAMRARIEGTVDLEGIVTTAGVLLNIRIARSLDAVNGLDQEAIRTAQLWRFSPGRRNDAPVNVRVTIEMAFTMTLREQDDPIRVSYHLDSGVTPPEVIRRTPPKVTDALRASEFQGVLEVDGTVQVEGAVKISAVRIIAFRGGAADSGSLAEDEVRRAIGDWKLTPAKKDGVAVPQAIKVIVHLPPD